MERSEAEEYARWFRCLADATRLQLLRVLAEGGEPMTVGELVEAVGVGQSSVSGHVRRLAADGFVWVERVGTATYVRINEDCLIALPAAAAAIMGGDRENDARAAVEGAGPEAAS
ncbi:ArsR family transcriptional regulator [Egibacter rhizosphaerae]|uniref:ArsR family transcriptional regulator n=1 Tax=Egibacter rhizosphaerae TaxID=1670831 RepID=A0A411YFV8_9ACTN|nr:metalloregulator ArsR/SmtB family transcription factor [Egibacter rhizosphaerae]QBI20098.1 ArsR family transcriptional regulator [Egibacter rhizosphaerae]